MKPRLVHIIRAGKNSPLHSFSRQLQQFVKPLAFVRESKALAVELVAVRFGMRARETGFYFN
jgi:hypothetical protein